MKRLAVISPALMNGGVADAAEIVKERALRCPDDVPFREAIDELLLALGGALEEADLGGGALGEDFAELAELEEGDGGIAGEVRLGLGRKRDEAGVVVREVGEVGGGGGVHGRIDWEARTGFAVADVARGAKGIAYPGIRLAAMVGFLQRESDGSDRTSDLGVAA
jgi:hypothetical protein